MLLFVVVPIVEIVVIIQVGQAIGAWWTVLLLALDSILGAWLLKREGARSWQAFRIALQEGRWPGDEVAQGAMVIVGGTLLLTPGFVTDVVGFVLLIPVSRRVLSRTVRSRISGRVVGGPAGAAASAARSARGTRGGRGSDGTSGKGRRGSASTSTFDVEVVEIHREDRFTAGPGELAGSASESDRRRPGGGAAEGADPLAGDPDGDLGGDLDDLDDDADDEPGSADASDDRRT